jgi:Transcriptional activator of glycolytic enzymes
MQAYDDDDEIVASTIPPLQGVALQYKSTLDNLLSFVHNQDYTRDKTYTKGELRALTPHHILQWMNLKAFGVTDPALDANPTLARANSLEYWKKALSFFMPNRLIVWVSGRNEGNPTRSLEVNNLIKRVRKKEVRKQGVAPQCRRAMTEGEFRAMQNILRNHDSGSLLWKCGLYALTIFQFHLIARIDDTTQVLIENIRVHDSFCNALKTRLNWSKNVSEERDAPWQIVLGSMDTAFCVLTSLALWMELNLRSNPNAILSPYVFSFSDDNSIPNGGQKSKETAQLMFGKIFKMEAFTGPDGVADHLGSHSIRKFAATHTRRCGCSKDDKDIRGRWKSKARVSDVYEDTELPYPDAKVAEKLCIGGPCFYLFPEELTNNNAESEDECTSTVVMLKTFILSNVVPNIRQRLPDSAALVLGKALLWLIYSPYNETHNLVPQEFKNRIRMEVNEIVLHNTGGAVDASYNPIRRVPVVVTGDQGCVYIDVIPCLDNGVDDLVGASAGGGRLTTTTGGLQAQLLALQSISTQIRREIQELRTNQMADRVSISKNFTLVNANIRRIAVQPGVRSFRGTLAGGNDDARNLQAASAADQPVAIVRSQPSLSPNPKNLYELWQEYEVGIGGRKAAKLFSRSERGGKNKHKFCRRNVIWRIIDKIVRGRGHITADVVIDQIYAIYGQQTSVTKIINAIKEDIQRGRLNPNLR